MGTRPADDTRALAGALLSGNLAALGRGPPLLAVEGPCAGEQLLVRDGAVLGRGRGADLRLPDGLTSRRHARFTRAGTSWRVHDLGSKNGLRVNGRRTSAGGRSLAPGDRIALGASVLLFGATSPAAARAAPDAPPPAGAPRPGRARALAVAAWLTAAAALAGLAALAA